MHFIDEAKIFVKSGAGGAGCVSFRREANVPYGGPDGGNGGRGGNIVVLAVDNLNTLIDFRYKQHFKAKRGMHGMGRQRDGANAEDVIIKVPVGTQIFDEHANRLIVDMDKAGMRYILAKGGKGGKGNTHFKSSTNRAPRQSTPGEESEELWVWLKLKLFCDVGLVGLPNAGKSTLLSAVSRAKPKIADYPFTTLQPQLGVVYIDDEEFVMSDIPGLIKGAHEGVGLGTKFLKHVERCKTLLHIIDGTQENVVDAYKTIRNELESYSKPLAAKNEIIALNKIDAMSEEETAQKVKELEKITHKKIYPISAATVTNIDTLKRALLNMVNETQQDD